MPWQYKGATLSQPGVISAIDNSGISNVVNTNNREVVFVGSAGGGQPKTVLQFSDVDSANNVLQSGNGLVAVLRSLRPAKDQSITPGTIRFVRVDPAVQSTYNLVNGSVTCLQLTTVGYGDYTKQANTQVQAGSVQGLKATMTINTQSFTQDNIYAGAITVQYLGASASGLVTVSNGNAQIQGLSGALGSETVQWTATFANYPTVQALVNYINSQANWSATIVSAPPTGATANYFDDAASQACKTTAYTVTANLNALLNWYTGTGLVTGVRPSAIANPASAPTLATATTGGSLAAATYYVKYTWVNINGETVGSGETSVTTTGTTSTVTVTLPAFPVGVTSANVYISTSTGTETKQGSTTTTTYTQTAALAAGSALPTNNTTGAGLTPTAMSAAAYFTGGSSGVPTNSDWTSALQALQNEALARIIVPLTDSSTIHAMVDAHCQAMSASNVNKNRVQICGGVTGESVTQAINRVAALNSRRTALVYPGIQDIDPVTFNLTTYHPWMAAAQAGALLSALPITYALTRQELKCSGLEGSLQNTLQNVDYDNLTNGGVMAIRYKQSQITGTAYYFVRSLTTWQGDTKLINQELSMVCNEDYIDLRVAQAISDYLVGNPGSPVGVGQVISAIDGTLRTCFNEGSIVGDTIKQAYSNITVNLSSGVVTGGYLATIPAPMNFFGITASFQIYSKSAQIGA